MNEMLPQPDCPDIRCFDGPAREPDTSIRRLAQSALTGVKALHAEVNSAIESKYYENLCRELETNEPAPEVKSTDFANLTSWVPNEYSEAYALLYRPLINDVPAAEIDFFTVDTDMDSEDSFHSDPTHIEIYPWSTQRNRDDLLDQMVDELGKEKLCYLIELVDKAFRGVESGDPEPVDPIVEYKLRKANFRDLSVYFTPLTIPFIEVQTKANIYVDDGIGRVARQRLRAEADTSRKNSIYLQHAPLELNSPSYFLRLDGERTPRQSTWELKKLRVLKYTYDKVETLEYSPDSDTVVASKESTIETDVAGVFATIENGEYFRPRDFNGLWSDPASHAFKVK